MTLNEYVAQLYEYVKGLNERLQQLTNDFTTYQQNEKQDKILEATIKFVSPLFDKASTYFNIIVVAGYAAFFTVWKTMQYLMSKEAMWWSGLLISFSCLVFIVWQIIIMIIHSLNSRMLVKAFDGPAETLLERLNACKKKSDLNSNRLMKYWIWQLLLTVIPGLAGAMVMINSFISSLLE